MLSALGVIYLVRREGIGSPSADATASRRAVTRFTLARSVAIVATFVAPAAVSAHVGRGVVDAAVAGGFESTTQARLASGVTHQAGTITTSEGTQVAHVATADTTDPSVSIRARLSNDRVAAREKVSSLADRTSKAGSWAVAAVNGDFWSGTSGTAANAPLGLHIQAGEVMVAGTVARPTLGIDRSGGLRLERANVQVSVSLPDGRSLAVDRVNQARGTDETVLYTSRFAARTGTDASGTEVLLRVGDVVLRPAGDVSAVVIAVRAASGDSALGTGEAVLSATGADAARMAALARGDVLTLTSAATPGWDTVRHALGGDRFVVQDGAVRVSSVFGRQIGPAASFVHPRTAVGLTAAGRLVMATVDGRQPGYSTGATVGEMGELMRSLGAVTAINLDGGGSTTMVVRPPGSGSVRVANRPSDGRERAVTNELVVYSRDPFPPVVSAPTVRLTKDRALLRDGRIPVTLAWSAADPSGVADVTLQQDVNGTGWEDVPLAEEGHGSVELAVTRGDRHAFRVRATDALGNRSGWASGKAVIARVREHDHADVAYGSGWVEASDADASGGSVSSATAPGSTLTFSFTGETIALVAPRGPDGGRAEVSVDGGSGTLVDLASDPARDRQVVYRRRLANGAHVVRVTVRSGPPEVVRVDAFVILARAP